MARSLWETLPDRFPSIRVDAFVIMPNHVHGILVIVNDTPSDVGASLVGALAPALGDVIGAYKSLTTVEYIKGVEISGWQPFDGVYGSATTTSTSSEPKTSWSGFEST